MNIRRFWVYVGDAFAGEIIEPDSADVFKNAQDIAVRSVGTTSQPVYVVAVQMEVA
jgi:hypothetical protein